jgi:hypothetical protein
LTAPDFDPDPETRRPGRSMRRPYMGKIKNKGMVTIYGSVGMVRLTFFDSHDKIKVELS